MGEPQRGRGCRRRDPLSRGHFHCYRQAYLSLRKTRARESESLCQTQETLAAERHSQCNAALTSDCPTRETVETASEPRRLKTHRDDPPTGLDRLRAVDRHP